MLHINIHPEDAIRIKGQGHEQELAEIVNNYFSQCSSLPEHLKNLSWDIKHLSETIDLTYEYIHERAFDGDIKAEIALRDMEDILNTRSFPNYFAVQEERNLNTRLAKQGEIYSMAMLGDRYYRGKGFKQNYYKAFEWYMKAAELGVKQAQYNVGGCYEMGRGIKKNMVKAIYWYTKAAEQGLEAAKRNLVRIELQKSNTQEDITSYLPTYVWEGERDTAIKDEFGVEYSADGKRLLHAPDNLKEYTVKEGTQVICDWAFARCEELSHITIPEGVLVIGGKSFFSCENLKHIIIPNSTREILEKAFKYSAIESIEIPDNVKYLGDRSFCECYNLKSIRIGKNVSEIKNEILIWNKKLTSIEVDSENPWYDSRNNCNAIIETKTNRLIAGCHGTKIPDTISSIGESAFWGTAITNINIPGNVVSIGKRAFFQCKNLEAILMQDGVKIIGNYAFEECTNLKTVKLPETLTKIEREAFRYCSNLKSLKLPDSIERLEDAFFCNHIISNIPKSIKKIEKFVCKCYIHTEIIIPEGVKIISESAFRFASATKITIPQSVEYIGKEAFYGCKNLETVVLLNPNTKIEENAFACCDKLKKLNFKSI